MGSREVLGGMELTQTEKQILRTASALFGIPAVPPEVNGEAASGTRPQLGDLLVKRGLLTPAQLDEVLDQVFEDLRVEGDRLAPPAPVQVPRPPDAGGDLGQLVERLTALLDLLVGEGVVLASDGTAPAAPAGPARPSSISSIPPAAARALSEIQALGTGSLSGAMTIHEASPFTAVTQQDAFSEGPATISEGVLPEPEQPDDDDTRATLQGERGHRDDQAGTMQVERDTGNTLQVERGDGDDLDQAMRELTLQMEREEPAPEFEGSTLHVERNKATGKSSTLQRERPRRTPNNAPASQTIHVEREERENTLQLERPGTDEGTLHVQREDLGV